MRNKTEAIEVRPYQVLCAICHVGAEECPPGVRALTDAIAAGPDRPITLVCNAGGVFAYQQPGTDSDSDDGPEFNCKRDLDILQRLDLAPGSTPPARTLLMLTMAAIPTVKGICGYDRVTADIWRGCAHADSGRYERNRELGVAPFIAARPEEELVGEKLRSMEALHSASEVTIRPHLLMCATCQYGAGIRPPLRDDNLPELLELILSERPDLPIRFAPGADWMMCAPCPARVPELNACVNTMGSGGLSNQKRDLDLLRLLGLGYGSSLPARELLLLLFERVRSTREVCGRDNRLPSVWWDGCGEHNHENPQGNENHRKGRRALLRRLRKLSG